MEIKLLRILNDIRYCHIFYSASINVSVRRLGGAYGGKISKASHVAAACAVAAYVTNRPVRLVVDLDTNMKTFGKRLPYLFKYEVISFSMNIIL